MISSFQGENRFLSNFFEGPVPIRWDGFDCATAEHAYQCSKTHNPSLRGMLATAATAGQAKRAGRNVPLRDNWEGVKLSVMRGVLAQKFEPGSELGDRLLATGDRMLIEGNHWNDTYWGRCKGRGQNWLGHLLMARRAELRTGGCTCHGGLELWFEHRDCVLDGVASP